MKTKCLVAMLAMVGASLCAAQGTAEQRATVTVCMDLDQQLLRGVRPLASKMFASIGVKIDWRVQDSCPAGVGAIQVLLSNDKKAMARSQTLAFARPHERTVVVFLNRVQASNRNHTGSLIDVVLAHVLVHEITHVLEGVDRHSATGIMKALWDYGDYFEMRRKPLVFAQEDINLIYDGLKVARVDPAAVVARAAVAGQ